MRTTSPIHLVFALLLMLAAPVASSQQQMIDSLEHAAARYEQSTGQRKLAIRDTTLVNIYHGLAVAYSGNDLKKAMDYANKELSISRQLKFDKGIASAYNLIGTLYDSKSDLAQAVNYYKQSLDISKKIGDKTAEAFANGNIGNIYGKQSNYSEAIKYQLRALVLAKKLNDKFMIAGTYNNIGVMYMQQDNYVQALESFFGCLKIMEKVGNGSAVGMIANNIGQIYALQGKSVLAVKFLEKGLKSSTQANDKVGMANNYNGLGHVYTETKDYRKALDYYLKSLKLSVEFGDEKGTARNNIFIGRTYYLMGQTSKAMEYIRKGNAYVQSNQDPDLQQNLYEIYAKIYAAQNDYKKAYENHIRFKDLTDSLLNKENAENFSRLKLQYDFKNAQDSITAIQSKKDILTKAEIKNQRETRNFVYLVLGLIVAFLIIIIWQRNKIAIVKRQKALVEERNRISRDLHDNLGAQLSTVRMFMSSLKNKGGEASGQTVDHSIGMLDASIHELRGIMNEMSDPVLTGQGFLAATEALINKINQLHGVQFTLTHHKLEDRPSIEIEHQLYRICQELVNNTLKYAKAKNVSLDVLRRDNKVILMYEDDGIGYDIGKIKKGYGLNNIETRTKSLGGSVAFDSMPNAGARTIIEIPE